MADDEFFPHLLADALHIDFPRYQLCCGFLRARHQCSFHLRADDLHVELAKLCSKQSGMPDEVIHMHSRTELVFDFTFTTLAMQSARAESWKMIA